VATRCEKVWWYIQPGLRVWRTAGRTDILVIAVASDECVAPKKMPLATAPRCIDLSVWTMRDLNHLTQCYKSFCSFFNVFIAIHRTLEWRKCIWYMYEKCAARTISRTVRLDMYVMFAQVHSTPPVAWRDVMLGDHRLASDLPSSGIGVELVHGENGSRLGCLMSCEACQLVFSSVVSSAVDVVQRDTSVMAT